MASRKSINIYIPKYFMAVSKGGSYGNKILSKNLKFFDKIFVRKS